MVTYKNTTNWNTEDLIELFETAMDYRGVTDDQVNKVHFRQWQTGSRRAGVTKHRTFEENVNINLREPAVWGDFPTTSVTQTILHELDHVLGLSHKDMPDSSELSVPDNLPTIRPSDDARDRSDWMKGPAHPNITDRLGKRGADHIRDAIWNLEEGDKVLFNDRKQPLDVTWTDTSGDRKVGAQLEGPQGGEYRLQVRNEGIELITSWPPSEDNFLPGHVGRAGNTKPLKWLKVIKD